MRRYSTVTPYLVVPDAARVIEFARAAFGAEERFSSPGPDGAVVHAEISLGDSVVMIGQSATPFPGMLYVYVDDVDARYRRALECGATSVQEPADQHYGDRTAGVADPGGNQWWLAKHLG